MLCFLFKLYRVPVNIIVVILFLISTVMTILFSLSSEHTSPSLQVYLLYLIYSDRDGKRLRVCDALETLLMESLSKVKIESKRLSTSVKCKLV